MALMNMDPDDSSQVTRGEDELRPILATFGVTFVGGGRAEGERQTDDETGDGKQDIADAEGIDELADALDHGRPQRQEQQGEQHLGQDAAMHPEEEWPFRMPGYVARTGEIVLQIDGFAHRATIHRGEMQMFGVVVGPGSRSHGQQGLGRDIGRGGSDRLS
nr:hypothetical protein CFP56_58707 [Quercus suber]